MSFGQVVQSRLSQVESSSSVAPSMVGFTVRVSEESRYQLDLIASFLNMNRQELVRDMLQSAISDALPLLSASSQTRHYWRSEGTFAEHLKEGLDAIRSGQDPQLYGPPEIRDREEGEE
jgi:hypothetical protein